MVEKRLFLVVEFDVDFFVEPPSLFAMFVLWVTDLQCENFCLSLFLLYAQTSIEGHYTPSIQFLILVVPLCGKTELAYFLGLGWAGLGVVVLSWSGGFVVMYRELAV